MKGKPVTILIRIEPYLAEYARSIFATRVSDGGVRMPSHSGLYHMVYDLLEKRRRDQPPAEGNLCLTLPCRRIADGTPSDGDDDCQPLKNPHYYNYLSPQSCRRVENYLRMRFNLEFHEVMMENEEQGRPQRHIEAVRQFLRRHRLTAISEDALLKNFRRFRHRVYPKKVRTYTKSVRNKKV